MTPNPARLFVVILATAVASLAACADPPPSKYPTAGVHIEDTRLGAGDVFEVRVYRQEAMSNTFNVSPEGTIAFPLIGEVTVSGKTPKQVEEEIRTRLADGYLVDPQVSVLVKEYRSQNVSVFGQVQKPGKLPFSPNMTIVDAISQAGGFSPMAKKNAVTVTRAEGKAKKTYTVPVESIGDGDAPNFFMRPGDVVWVPERLF
jgi:protein involved in polysaccharide export with SLBB domain